MYGLLTIPLIVASMLSPETPHTGMSDNSNGELEGTWVMIKGQVQNKQITQTALVGSEKYFIFHGDRWRSQLGNQKTGEGTFKTGLKDNPKALDLQIETGADMGITQLAIYSIDGDILTLVASHRGEERPRSFASVPGEKQDVFVFKRVKGDPFSGPTLADDRAKLVGKWRLETTSKDGEQLEIEVVKGMNQFIVRRHSKGLLGKSTSFAGFEFVLDRKGDTRTIVLLESVDEITKEPKVNFLEYRFEKDTIDLHGSVKTPFTGSIDLTGTWKRQ